MEIRIHTTNDELNIAFTSWLKEVIKDKESVTIALSGGSTPKSLFQYWANLQNDEIDWMFMEQYMKRIENNIIKKQLLQTENQ